MSESVTQVVTRFAPSPTGELHIGGARTALFSWAYARGRGGRFYMRFEDTDRKRSSKQAEVNALRDMEWLGLDYDHYGDSPDGIPRQSDRLELYNEAIAKLADAGLTYEDDGAIRLRMDQPVSFRDEVYGDIAVEADSLEDFVIRKKDGFPTFHLAVVVDDAAMGVTHVIRGQEHLSNTAKHARLYDALGAARPVWVHTPSIMNPDGSKMSKRDKAKAARKAAANAHGLPSVGFEDDALAAFMNKDSDDVAIAVAIAEQLDLTLPEIDVADFMRSGYLPEVICNYIALLGWNPKDGQERFTKQAFAERFDFKGINKANAKFDRNKLAAFNQEALAAMPPAEFAAELRRHFAALHMPFIDKLGEGFDRFAAMYQERSRTLDDPASLGRFFIEPPAAYDAKAVKKNLMKNGAQGLSLLGAFKAKLDGGEVEPWDAQTIQAALDAFVAEHNLPHMGPIAQALRVALTGAAVSPPIDTTLELLGKDETRQRIDACISANSMETPQ